MKTIIAGSRTFDNYQVFKMILEDYLRETELPVTEVFSGLAKGPDLFGKQWAEENNIPVREFPADWDKYQKSAGAIRNQEMLDADAESLIAFWDGESRGTKHMIDIAKKKGISVNIFTCNLRGNNG